MSAQSVSGGGMQKSGSAGEQFGCRVVEVVATEA
jgi:hypothetical protein